jgi:sugar lactone lactonase YvrE
MKRFIKSLVTASLVSISLTAASASAAEQQPLWQLDGLNQPESVLAGPNGKVLYISNINGQPAEKNKKGYISRVTADGNIIDKHWIDGLDAPKGMVISQDHLYVADMQTLHVISLNDGKIVKRYQVNEAKMLNDVTVGDNGEIYISDLLGGGIYRLSSGRLDAWFSHEKLPHPNGVLWSQGALYVANWGEGMNADFSTQVPGTLYRLDVEKKELKAVPTGYELGNLDGIVANGNQLYVSDWITGELYQLTNKERRKVLQLQAGLADIGGSANGVVYAPMMMDNRVVAWQMP